MPARGIAAAVAAGVIGAFGVLAPASTEAAAAAAPSSPPQATTRFTLSDPRLSEISGLAPGLASPSVVYGENDSGHPAQFFALDARTGAVRGVFDVPGARNVDWEDLAVAPDAQGRPSVWLADIGDNDAARPDVQVYRVDEPRLRAGQVVVGSVDSARPDVWTLRYPTGAVNAESLMVTPRGVGYIVTKSVIGVSTVYRMPTTPGPATLTAVGTVRFAPTGVPDPVGPIGQLTATGAAVSPDGTALAIRTYSSAYLWPVHDGDVAGALTATPVRVTLPAQPQGESIAFAGADLLIASEHVGSPVYELARPALGPAAPAVAPSSTGTGSAPGPTVRSTPDPSKAKHPGANAGTVLIVLMLVLIGGAGWLAANRRRMRRRRPGAPPNGAASGHEPDDRPGSNP